MGGGLVLAILMAGTSWISLQASLLFERDRLQAYPRPPPATHIFSISWFHWPDKLAKIFGRLGHAATSTVIKFGKGAGKSILYRLDV